MHAINLLESLETMRKIAMRFYVQENKHKLHYKSLYIGLSEGLWVTYYTSCFKSGRVCAIHYTGLYYAVFLC